MGFVASTKYKVSSARCIILSLLRFPYDLEELFMHVSSHELDHLYDCDAHAAEEVTKLPHQPVLEETSD